MKVAIIGLGYVGLPLSLQFSTSKFEVIAIDINEQKVNTVNSGRSPISNILNEEVQTEIKSGRLIATNDFSRISNNQVQAILICVPTPLDIYRQPDLSHILASAKSISPYLKPEELRKKLVVLESTTYPGTTDTELKNVLESESGLIAGKDFHLAYSPERLRPGSKASTIKNATKLIGGYTPECLNRSIEIYSKVVHTVHPVTSCRIAEAAKILENAHRFVNIALMNELKFVLDDMDINVSEVIEAALTRPFERNDMYPNPGPGIGGHCIPIDSFYLTWKARQYGHNIRMIELAGQINDETPSFVLNKIILALNNECKSVKSSQILLMGLAYKPNVDDDRESPCYPIWKKLNQMGAKISYNDPYIPEILATTAHNSEYCGQISVEISDNFDCIVLITHHDQYKMFDFSNFKTILVDSRNAIDLEKRPRKYYRA